MRVAFVCFQTAKKGMTKKSIFASPDNVNGRVGIGTCGMSGKPMTEFTTAEKWRKGVWALETSVVKYKFVDIPQRPIVLLPPYKDSCLYIINCCDLKCT